MTDPTMAAVAAEWTNLTLALVGVGALNPSPLLAKSGNAFDADEQAGLLAEGAVGDVCCRFFTAAGAPVGGDLVDRIVGIDADTLRAVPRRIGVAGGAAKHRAIRAALAGGWVNTIITDLATAKALLLTDSGENYDGRPPPQQPRRRRHLWEPARQAVPIRICPDKRVKKSTAPH